MLRHAPLLKDTKSITAGRIPQVNDGRKMMPVHQFITTIAEATVKVNPDPSTTHRSLRHRFPADSPAAPTP